MKKSIIFGIVGTILGILTDYFQSRETEAMVDERVNAILEEKGLIDHDE